MLVDPVHISADERGLASTLAMIGGGDPTPRRIQRGLYEISHFSLDHCLRDVLSFAHEAKERFGYWLRYPDLGEQIGSDALPLHEFECYGVCDSPQQFLEHSIGKWILEAEKGYVVGFSRVVKAEQPPADGGWRWHKWGPYIGAHEPQCEYIHDEGDEIEAVYCFHIYESLSDGGICPIEEN